MIGWVRGFGKGGGMGFTALAVLALGVSGGPAEALECLLDTNNNNLADTGVDTTGLANDSGLVTATACGPRAFTGASEAVAPLSRRSASSAASHGPRKGRWRAGTGAAQAVPLMA